MTIPGTNIVKRKHIILMIYGTILLAMSHVPAFAQELPPKPLTIIATTLQNMNFGTFLIGSSGSGSVIIYPDGSRICSGNVFPVNSTTSALRYEVVAPARHTHYNSRTAFNAFRKQWRNNRTGHKRFRSPFPVYCNRDSNRNRYPRKNASNNRRKVDNC
jgi:hypothetical protein